jgi:hypothetical protein
MPAAFIKNWTVEQCGESVTVSLKWGSHTAGTTLQKSWFGWITGNTDDFQDETSAHYAFTEVVRYMEENL